MEELDRYIAKLTELADEAPMTIVKLPDRTRGLPEHSYNLQKLLGMIIANLKGEKPNCR